MSESVLRAALRHSLRREQHILAGAAAIAASISVAAVRSSAPPSTIITWFVGCAAMVAVGRAWYRWRTRVCDQVVAAIEGGAVVTKLELRRLTINFVIPFGYGVSFDAGKAKHPAFAFWTRAAADQLVAALGGVTSLPAARVV